MQPMRIHFEPADAPQTALDRTIEWMLIALLAFAPAAFGAVYAWSEGIIEVLCYAMAICLALKLVLRTDARFVWSWAYLPIALFILLILAQLVPFPAAIVRVLSPNTALLKFRLLAGLPAGAEAARSMPLTFYSEATLRQLRLVFAMACLFIVVINIFQRVESIRRLLIAIVFIGLAQALLALAQDITHSSSIYWAVPVYDLRALSGTFVNHNHFGQFMNLSIGAAISLVLLERHAPRKHGSVPQSNWMRWIAGITIVACAIATVLSLTRGGVIAMLAAGAFSLAVLRVKIPAKTGVLLGASLLAAAIVIVAAWLGFDEVYHRFASITETNAANWRGQMLIDLPAAWKAFPIFGTGLGTHAVIFPMYDHSQTAAVATHAENEYAQMLTETGAAGLLLVAIFIVMIWRRFIRSVGGRFSSRAAISVGLGYGFLAILIHSSTDFGQHIPADALLTTITCALLVSLARQSVLSADDARPPKEFHGSKPARLLAGAVLLLACVFATYESTRSAVAEREWNITQTLVKNLRDHQWHADSNAFANLIIHAQNAARIRPGNIEYAYWLAFYRWKWTQMQVDPSDAHYLDFARRIADDFNHIRTICPTFGLPATMAGQIETFVLHDPRGPSDIDLGSELDRNDPTAIFVGGKLAASRGQWDASLELLGRYGRLTVGGPSEGVDLYVRDFNRPDLALRAAQDDAPALEHLADLLSLASGDAQIISDAKNRAGDLEIAAAEKQDADFTTLICAANACADRHDDAAAIRYLRRAIELDYTQSDARIDLAKALVSSGKKEDGVKELRTVLRQHPDSKEAQKMLDELLAPK